MMTPVIFYKDSRILLKSLLIVPAILVIYYIGMKLIGELHYGIEVTADAFGETCVIILAVFDCLVAILAGAQMTAEERNAETDLLLARLPISSRHLYAEKIAAGSTCVALLYVASLVFLSFFNLDAFDDPDSIGTIPGNFFIIMFSGYLFAVIFSRFTHQAIAILFLAFGAECLLWFGIVITALVSKFTEADWYALPRVLVFTLLCFVVPVILVWKQWQLPLHPTVWGTDHKSTQIKGLCWKSFTENGLLNVMCLLLLVAATAVTGISYIIGTPATGWLSADSGSDNLFTVRYCITGMGGLLLAALGTNSYTAKERSGLNCIAYHHPIPRSQFFLTKQVAAVPAIILVSLTLIITWGENVPAVAIVVFSLFFYLQAVQMCLAWQTGTVVVMLGAVATAWSILVLIFFGWMEPSDNPLFFEGFTPVHDPILVGLIPLAFVTVGSFISAWLMATNRRVLAGSDRYRQRYCIACYAVLFVVTCLLMTLIRAIWVL